MMALAHAQVLKNDLLKEEIHYAETGGLRVFVLPKKGFRRKYAEMFVHYGSNDNAFIAPGGQKVEVPPGIAHFLEHKMFEKEGGDAFSDFSRVGASANAFTSNSYTSYLFWTLNNWDEALRILFNVAYTPYFTDETVAKEQNIIGQEIRMYNDEPGSRMMRETMEALYKMHPVRLDVAGTEDSIKAITKDLLYLCHRTFYRPSNMALYVAGDLDPQAVFDAAAKLVGEFAPGDHTNHASGEPQRLRPDEPAEVGENAEVDLPVPVPLVDLSWKDVPAGDDGERMVKEEIGASILLDILFGKSSAFFSKAYEEGLLDELSASYEAWPDYAYAAVGAQTSKPEELSDQVQAEIERVRKTGVDEKDFLRTKRASIGRFATLFDSFDTVGEMQVHLSDIGLDVFRYGQILDRIDIDDVNAKIAALRKDRSVRTIIREK